MGALAADSAFYACVDAFVRLISLSSVPLYTHFLSQQDFGALDLVTVVAAFFSLATSCQFEIGIARYYYEVRDVKALRAFMSTWLIAPTLWLSGAYVISLPLVLPLSRWLFVNNTDAARWLFIAFGTIIFNAANDRLRLYSRLLAWKGIFLINALCAGVLQVAMTALFLKLHWGILGVLTAQLIAAILTLAIQLILFRSHLFLKVSLQALQPVLSFSLPMAATPMLGWGLSYLNRLITAKAISLEQLAIYALAMKIATPLTFIAGAFQLAWLPLSMRQIRSPDAAEFYVNSFRYYIGILLAVNLMLTLAAEPLVSLLAPKAYGEAAKYVPLVLISSTIMIAASVLDIGNQIRVRTWWSSVARAVAIVVGTVITLLAVNSYGLMAVIAGNLAASVTIIGITYVTAQHSYRLPYERSTMLLGGIAFGIIGLLPQGGSLFHPLFVDVAMGLTVLIIIIKLMLSASDRTRIWVALNRIGRRYSLRKNVISSLEE